MNCNEFWKRYEESGLTPGLEKHLNECKNCKHELLIECELEKTVKTLQRFKAPERAWEVIRSAIEENHVTDRAIWSLPGKIRGFFRDRLRFPVIHLPKPAVVGIAFVVLATIGITYYYSIFLSPVDEMRLQAKAMQELEEIEQDYITAIEKFSVLVEHNKENIDPDLYDLYQGKLALLDEYILQCKEAISENEYNINAMKYLALAYKGKMETLKEMSEYSYIY